MLIWYEQPQRLGSVRTLVALGRWKVGSVSRPVRRPDGRPWARLLSASAEHPSADIEADIGDFSFVPIGDMVLSFDCANLKSSAVSASASYCCALPLTIKRIEIARSPVDAVRPLAIIESYKTCIDPGTNALLGIVYSYRIIC
jgi:hypothetical protein